MPKQSNGTQRGSIMLRRGRWTVRVVIRGREHWKGGFRTRDEAELYLGRVREDAARGRLGLPKVQRATLREFVERVYLPWARLRKRSVDRDERALKHLLPVFGDLRLSQITRERVEAYQADRLKDRVPGGRTTTPRTVNIECSILRRILSRALEVGELDTSPLARLPMVREAPPRQPVLTREDEARLLAACSPWLADLVRVALATGMRQGELLAMRWKHVDLDARVLVIPDSKTAESRRVPLAASAVAVLEARRGLPEAWVFPGGGGPLNRHVVSKAFRIAARRAGLGGLHFHDLRHVAATRWLAQGASLPEVASLLGHKTLAVSRRYAHVTWTRLTALVDAAGEGEE